jgi:phosphonate metabolism protein PhnN/1,5-bisphosphokinase (PRPP-forming)
MTGGGTGTLFLVVGPSGAGKDTLLAGARAALAEAPDFVFPRRFVTRPADAGGEDHIPIAAADFEARAARGAFLASWHAHGLAYAVPVEIAEDLRAGRHVVVNVSRGVVGALGARHPSTLVIHVTAAPSALRGRLAGRARESAADVEARLARAAPVAGAEGRLVEIRNDGTVAEGVAAMLETLLSARRTPPDSPGAPA